MVYGTKSPDTVLTAVVRATAGFCISAVTPAHAPPTGEKIE